MAALLGASKTLWLAPGSVVGMSSGWRPTHEDPLFILAFDHRDSFAKLLGEQPSPSGAGLARLEGVKGVVYDGLLRARADVDQGRVGALVDEQFGAAVIARSRADGMELAVPIEASGKEWFEPAWGAEWLAHVKEVSPDFGKVLVRDNPDLDPAQRESQLARLREVSERLDGLGVPLIYELLVPATSQQLDSVGGDGDRYDAELRAELTARIIADNHEHGVRPRLWKVEGLESETDAELVAAAARAGADADLIVLGRDAPRERLEHWLRVASAVPEFVGFAIGRSIWQDVITELDPAAPAAAREKASAEIAVRYLGYVSVWLAGRYGARHAESLHLGE